MADERENTAATTAEASTVTATTTATTTTSREGRRTSKSLCHGPANIAPEGQSAFEYSVHRCPRRMREEMSLIFGPVVDPEAVLIVPTFQLSKEDLVGIGPHIELEKDRLLERFAAWAKAACAALRGQGHWADYTDPCSGYPALGERFASLYPDVLGAQTLMKYDLTETGCCKMLSHPTFGTKVYPATMFSTAPLDAVVAACAAAAVDNPAP